MIEVVLEINSDGQYQGFSVKGHSNSAPKGEDIICAAVSAVVQTALIGLDEVAEIKGTYEIKDGFINCRIQYEGSEAKKNAADIILCTMHMGLESIAEQYKKFVRIKICR